MHLLLAGLAMIAGADTPRPDWLRLDRGTRVQLMVEDAGPMREVSGRLLASDAASVTVQTASGPTRLLREDLFHLRYRTERRDRQKGAAIGAAITGAVGLVAGFVVLAREVDPDESCSGCIIVPGLFMVGAAIPGGAIGFVIGAPGGEWHDVKPDGLTVIGSRPPRRTTLALRFGPR